MFKKLLPKETNFFDYFDRHAALAVQASEALRSLFLTGSDGVEKARRIKELELKADDVTRQCIEALRKTFITPFERDDIYRLISKMDDVVDYTEEIAARMAIYHLTEVKKEIKELVDILVSATQELESALKELRSLKRIENLQKSLKIIHDLERQADIIVREAISRLFDEEPDIRLVVKWKEIYDTLENGVDRCQDVANIIEGVILEYE